MSRFKNEYVGYRGRRTLKDILRLIAIILGILVLLMGAGLLFGQRYIVYTDDGLRVEWPFGEEKRPEPLEPGDVSVVVRPQEGHTPPEELLEETEEMALSALELPLEVVLDGTARQQLDEAGANALILEMKGPEGLLNWQSEKPLAIQAKVNSERSEINARLEEWNRGDVYTIARVCCFRDNTMPYQRNAVALRAGYGNWRDELGLRWLDPDNADARAYLAQLCGELARLGFDEILLECCAFPTLGNREAIVQKDSFVTGQYAVTTEAFLNEVAGVLEPYDTVLAVRVERDSLTGADTLSGLTPAVLERCAHRLWMAEDGASPALLDLMSGAGIQEPDKRLVRVTSSLTDGADQAQAVLNP